jgi:uncharacterized protein YutE (UPF0331/DUF86 family)
MTQDEYVQNLSNDLELLERSLFWLKRSFDICSAFGCKEVFSAEEYDAVETLTSRYARTSDILIQKIFRSIDKVELEDRGTMIDVINRADKRRLFESVDEIREIRDLRNKIAHEYSKEDLEKLFADVVRLTPRLHTISGNIFAYCARYGIKRTESPEKSAGI